MAAIWQSSGFWLVLSSIILLLVAFMAIRYAMPDGTDTPARATVTGTPRIIGFPSPDRLFMPLELRLIPPVLRDPTQNDPPDISYEIEKPSCYSLVNGDFSCIGKFWNTGNTIAGDTSLTFVPDIRDGLETLNNTAIEQRITPPGTFAAYRTTVNKTYFVQPEITGSVAVDVLSFPPAEDIRALRIEASRGEMMANGRYQLSVTVANNSGFAAQDIRVFTTLDSNEWGVVGYNVHEVGDTLQNGASRELQVELIPLAVTNEVLPIIHVEGRIHQD